MENENCCLLLPKVKSSKVIIIELYITDIYHEHQTVSVACCVLHNTTVMYREDNVENSLIDDFNCDDEGHITQNVLLSVLSTNIFIVQTFAVNN